MAIYTLFEQFIKMYGDIEDRKEMLEKIMELRAEFAVRHAIKGFDFAYDQALLLLKAHNNGLTKKEKEQRDILVAAIDNLVDFAVAEEYQMYKHLPEEIDYEDDENIEEFEDTFALYNSIYADVENKDIEYAMGMAAAWVSYASTTILTYMTQGDNRVRPWHMALEGTSYPKKDFPAWLIPPIEHGCRCYLEEDSVGVFGDAVRFAEIQASKVIDKPDFVNPVFEESVCKGGRIFGPAHSYFTIAKKDKKWLRSVAERIKNKWLED